MNELEASLGFLNRERVEILFLHEPDTIDIDPDLMAALTGLRQSGIIGAIGLAYGDSTDSFSHPVSVVQSRYAKSHGPPVSEDVLRVFHGTMRPFVRDGGFDGMRRQGPRALIDAMSARPDAAFLFSASSPRRSSRSSGQPWMRESCACPDRLSQFAPNNTADSHRMRMVLPYLSSAGCEAEVLAVNPRDVRQAEDPWLKTLLPPEVPIHHVRAWPLRGWGLNGLAQRAAGPLYRKGCELLGSGQFDIVLFSTTRFLLHVLGPVWRSRFGTPFCMDYQDPWVNDYYAAHPEVVPPGGRVKYAFSDLLHRIGERFVVPRSSGFMAVSLDYLRTLDRRYGGRVNWQPRMVEPFPAEPKEFEDIGRHGQSSRDTRSPRIIRYIGRFVANMDPSATALFATLRRLLDEGAVHADELRIEAIGTAYYPNDSDAGALGRTASSHGVGDMVTERPGRIGYQETLELLRDADGLVVFGSDDPAYAASKIFPYLLARRPLLAMLHAESPVVEVMRAVGGGLCATFDSSGFADDGVSAIRQFLLGVGSGMQALPLDRIRFETYCAEGQARRIVEWLSTALQAERDSSNERRSGA